MSQEHVHGFPAKTILINFKDDFIGKDFRKLYCRFKTVRLFREVKTSESSSVILLQDRFNTDSRFNPANAALWTVLIRLLLISRITSFDRLEKLLLYSSVITFSFRYSSVRLIKPRRMFLSLSFKVIWLFLRLNFVMFWKRVVGISERFFPDSSQVACWKEEKYNS